MKLQINAFDNQAICRQKLIAEHIDATDNLTVIYRAEQLQYKDAFIVDKISGFNIMQGLVTIYFESGGFIEITKFNPGNFD